MARKSPAARLPGARKGVMPQAPRSQLATLVDSPPAGPEWLHEHKYDGYRLFARIERGRVRLLTRNDLDWTAKFPALAAALFRGVHLIIDGLIFRPEPATCVFTSMPERSACSLRSSDDNSLCALDVAACTPFCQRAGAPGRAQKRARPVAPPRRGDSRKGYASRL